MPAKSKSSASYASSEASSISQTVNNVGNVSGGGRDGGGVSDLLGRDASIQDSIYGVLYLLTKEPVDSNKSMAYLKLLFEALQMLVFLITPEWGWDIDTSNRLYPWFRRSQLQWIIVEKGYKVFTIALFLAAGAVAALLAALAFVSHEFKSNRLQQIKWVLRVCRVLVFLAFDMFYISLLALFLTGTDCLSGYNPTLGQYRRGYRYYFHGESCVQMPGSALVAVGAGAAVVTFLAGLLISLRDTVTGTYLAPTFIASSQADSAVRIHIAKTVIAIFAMNLKGEKQLQAIVMLVAYWYMLWCVFRRLPHVRPATNLIRGASFGMLAWTSLMLLLRVYNVGGKDGKSLSTAMFAMIPFGVLMGYVIVRLRLRRVYTVVAQSFTDIPEPQPGQPPHEIVHQFTDYYEVEVVARACLRRDRRGRIAEPYARSCEEAFRHGIKQFPDAAFLALTFSNFLHSVRQNQQLANTQLTRASKLPMAWGTKLLVFIRQMEEKSAQNQKTGDGTMDLASYVEFQQNYKVLVSAHTAALKAIRHFWRELLRGDVTFQHLTRALVYMDVSEGKADRTYQMIMERYPKSPKLLRAFAKYLEEVKHDPWGANKYYLEGDRLEDVQAEADREAMLSHVEGQGTDGVAMAQVDDSTDAVVVITDIGVIQFTNKILNKTFGYKIGELEGKNVSCLMPAPFSTQHNSYLRNYKMTGKAKILNKTREVIALHKERHVFPIRLTVTKIQQGDQDAYMAVIKTLEDDYKHGIVWCTIAGQVLCCNRGFTDLFGFRSLDLVGRNIKVVASNPDDMEAHIIEVGDRSKLLNDDEDVEDASKVHARFATACKHKYGAGAFRVDVEVNFAGTQAMRILVLKMVNKDQGLGIIAMDSQGNLQYASNAIDTMLGYDPGTLGNGGHNLSKIAPMPYSALHSKFVQEFAGLAATGMAPTPKATSCVTGRVISLLAKAGRSVPVRMRISLLKEGDEFIFTALVNKVTPSPSNGWGMSDINAQMLEHARIRLLLRSDGRIIATDAPANAASVPEPPFGVRREDVVGMMVSDVVDVFQAAVQQSRVFNANATPESIVGPFITRMIARANQLGILAFKAGLALGGSPNALTPARMVLKVAGAAGIQMDELVRTGQMDPSSVTGDLRSMFVCELYNTDALQGSLEVARTGEIRKVDQQASLIMGSKASMLEGKPLGQYLVGQLGAKVTDMLSIRIGRKIGERMVCDLTHAEGDECHVSMIGGVKNEDADRFVVMLGIPPGSAMGGNYRRIQEIVSAEPTGTQASTAQGGGRVGFAALDDEPRRDNNVRFTGVRSEVASEIGEVQPVKKKRQGTVKAADSDRASLDGSEVVMSDHGSEDGDHLEDREKEKDEGPPAPVEEDQRSQGSASEASSIGGASGEFRRAKRYKRLVRLLASPRARKPVSDLQFRSKLLSWLVVVVHLGIFVTSRILLTSQTSLVVSVKAVGDTLRHLESSMISARVIESIYNNSGHTFVEFNATQKKLLTDLNLFQTTIRSAFRYVLEKRYGTAAYRDYAVAEYAVDTWIDVVPMHYENDTMRAWDLFNVFTRKAKQVAQIEYYPEWHDKVYLWRHFRFIMDNGPFNIHAVLSQALDVEATNAVDNMRNLQNILLALLLAEGVLILPGFAFIMYITMRDLQTARMSLFSVFLAVPRPAIIALASKEANVDEDDSDDSDVDEDADWMKRMEDGGAGAAAAATADGKGDGQPGKPAPKLMKVNIKADRRKLRSSNYWELIKVVAPFMVYSILVVSIYGSALSTLNQTTRPLRDLISAEKLLEYGTRMRFWAHELVLAKTVADQDWYRWRLQIAATLLNTLYHSLLYGTGAEYEGLDGADSTLKGSLFRNPKIQKLAFTPGCLRLADSLPCFPPTSPYYEATTNGLDTLLHTLYDNAIRLSQDLPTDLSLNNGHFALMWACGPADFYGGLTKMTKLYVDDNSTPYNTIEVMEIVLLAIITVLCIGYVITISPFITRATRESKRVAQLMSMLPDDMDVETLVIEANGLLDDDTLLEEKEKKKAKAAKAKASAARSKAKSKKVKEESDSGSDSSGDTDEIRGLKKNGHGKASQQSYKKNQIAPAPEDEEEEEGGRARGRNGGGRRER